MKKDNNSLVIQNKIFTIDDKQVMLDKDLAELYGVETKVFNQAVKRNIDRFPPSFRFQLTVEDIDNLRSQIVTSSYTATKHGGRRYSPFVFTEQGVAMLSAILRSSTAIKISIQIIESFVSMRRLISANSTIIQRLNHIESKQLDYKAESDKNFNQIFDALDNKPVNPKLGVFYNGQVFDAYIVISDLIKKGKKSIILIDNYVDETVLTLLLKRDKNCNAIIYTERILKELKLDIEKHNKQYSPIEIKILKNTHDRFLILDKKEIYHIGASLKDLGNKIFAITKLEKENLRILDILEKP